MLNVDPFKRQSYYYRRPMYRNFQSIKYDISTDCLSEYFLRCLAT